MFQRPAVQWSLVAASYSGVVVVLFWRVFFADQIGGWDCLDEYWPDLLFQRGALADGELPLWNPYALGGYPVHADPQAGLLSPINWVCLALSALTGPGAILIGLKIALLFYVGLTGMHVLVHRWTRSHVAGAVAALTFVVGAPLIVHKSSALVWPLLHLPWILVAIDALRDRATVGRGGLVGFALGATGSTHPQGFFFCAAIVAAYVGFCGVELVLARGSLRAELRRLAPALVVAAAIAIVWLGLVYVPAWTTVGDSARSALALDWATSNPLEPQALAELFVPSNAGSWTHDIYLGPLAVILLLWSAVVSRQGRLWLALAVVSLLLALGYLLPWLAEYVPGFGMFRMAYRYKLVTAFACAAGAGLGVGFLATATPTRRQRRILLGLVGAWGGAVLVTWEVPTVAALATVLALGAALLDVGRRRWWLAALPLLVGVDLYRAQATKLALLEPRPATDRGAELLAQMPGVHDAWRYYYPRWLGAGGTLAVPYHATVLHGAREISGFPHPLAPRAVLDLLEKPPTEGMLVLSHFNVKYFVRERRGRVTVHAGLDVAPLARLYPRAQWSAATATLATFGSIKPSAVPHAFVDPIDRPSTALPQSTFAPVDGRLVTYERGRIVIDIDAPDAGILVINEVWAPPWRAEVDGRPTEVFRTNYMLRGLVVPRGSHRVELVFSVPGYRVGLVALGISPLLLLGLRLLKSRMKKSA
jgi:hypothetical protein